MKGSAAVAAAVIFACFAGTLEASGPTRVSGTVDQNRTWDEGGSPYLVEGNLFVRKGAVLTIRPGVTVRFQAGLDGKGGALVVQGGLVAEGADGRPVNFSQGAGAASWGGIYFNTSDPDASVLRRCVVIAGRVAVKDASPVIEQSTLYGAACAVQVTGKSSPRIAGNRIAANRVGLALTGPETSPLVARNTFTNNEYAVVAKDFGSPRITENLFWGNRAYNLVNQSAKPLEAAGNDFRTLDASAIAKTVYDSAKNPGFGPVRYLPFASSLGRGETRSAKAQDKFQERFSLTLDGFYANSQGVGVPTGVNNGLGSSFRMEYQFKPFLSMGLNFGYQSFTGEGQTGTAGMLDLMGRIIAYTGNGFEHYLIGGAGINPLYNRQTTPWIGRFHAMAGIGTRFSLDANWGLDLAGVYHFYTPMARHVDAFSMKMGVGYSFGL